MTRWRMLYGEIASTNKKRWNFRHCAHFACMCECVQSRKRYQLSSTVCCSVVKRSLLNFSIFLICIVTDAIYRICFGQYKLSNLKRMKMNSLITWNLTEFGLHWILKCKVVFTWRIVEGAAYCEDLKIWYVFFSRIVDAIFHASWYATCFVFEKEN